MAADLYTVLGVARTASHAEIRRRYHRLALQVCLAHVVIECLQLQHHPDKHGESEEMLRVQHAWEVLRNADVRAEYDGRLLAEEAWAGQCEQYGTGDIEFEENEASAECRCGTRVVLLKSDMIKGFSRVQCPTCSLRIQFNCSLGDFLL